VGGGSSVVPGMMLDRCSDAEYVASEELENVGWGWNAVEPCSKKAFTFTPPREETMSAFSAQGKGLCEVVGTLVYRLPWDHAPHSNS
jgi:hypothetical protein